MTEKLCLSGAGGWPAGPTAGPFALTPEGDQ